MTKAQPRYWRGHADQPGRCRDADDIQEKVPPVKIQADTGVRLDARSIQTRHRHLEASGHQPEHPTRVTPPPTQLRAQNERPLRPEGTSVPRPGISPHRAQDTAAQASSSLRPGRTRRPTQRHSSPGTPGAPSEKCTRRGPRSATGCSKVSVAKRQRRGRVFTQPRSTPRGFNRGWNGLEDPGLMAQYRGGGKGSRR